MTERRRPCGECESCRWGDPCPSAAPYQGDALVDLNGGKGTLWRKTAQGYAPVVPEPVQPRATAGPTPTAAPVPTLAAISAADPQDADLDDRDIARMVAALLRRLARREASR